jgi:hypothetical protein
VGPLCFWGFLFDGNGGSNCENVIGGFVERQGRKA